MNSFAWSLPIAAATVGALHTLAPDHWMPFAALARARGWTPARALRTTILCGLGHVTVSAILGIAALSIGLRGRLENVADAEVNQRCPVGSAGNVGCQKLFVGDLTVFLPQ